MRKKFHQIAIVYDMHAFKDRNRRFTGVDREKKLYDISTPVVGWLDCNPPT